MRTILGTALLLSLPTVLAAQRGGTGIALSPPNVRVSATQLMVTVGWGPVDGATSYTVEQGSSLNGPWTPLPMKPLATQVTAPTYAGYGNGLGGGNLLYYRVTASPSLGEPGVTMVPRVTPRIDGALGVDTREDGADLWVSWAPVPNATGYLVTLAPGQQLAPTHSMEVGAQYAEARLVNVALPNMPRTVWVAVNARYETALSSSTPIQFTVPSVHQCWPPASIPMPATAVSVSSGPTAVYIRTGNADKGLSTARVERALNVPQPVWQTVGCKSGAVIDASVTAGTPYQYRVAEVFPTGHVAQTIVVGATSAAPDNQIPTATVTGCDGVGCLVTLNWHDYTGTDGVRIESSYGLSQVYTTNWIGKGWHGPTTGNQQVHPSFSVPLPKGAYTFSLTTLYPRMRPTSRPPAQISVVVP